MNQESKLKAIFEDDDMGLLNVKPTPTAAQNADQRLVASFEEINAFIDKNGREPEQGKGVQEFTLFTRLRGLRESEEKMAMLKDHDRHDLLDYEPAPVTTIEDVLADDALGLLDDDSEGLYDLRHVTPAEDRASADFVAKRKRCRNFGDYEKDFKQVQNELEQGKRKLVPFSQDVLRAGDYFVYGGVLMYIESADIKKVTAHYKSGPRTRIDGRTRIIFENGTESNMLYRSAYKALLAKGKAVSRSDERVEYELMLKTGTVAEEDVLSGYIYVLRSLSEKPEIRSIQNLYKIGFSTVPVAERVKNAKNEPTYLMAGVELAFQPFACYNMDSPQKVENLLHRFFGKSCLNVEVTDKDGKIHSPREWFIAPIEVIQKAVELLAAGTIADYRYDEVRDEVVMR